MGLAGNIELYGIRRKKDFMGLNEMKKHSWYCPFMWNLLVNLMVSSDCCPSRAIGQDLQLLVAFCTYQQCTVYKKSVCKLYMSRLPGPEFQHTFQHSPHVLSHWKLGSYGNLHVGTRKNVRFKSSVADPGTF